MAIYKKLLEVQKRIAGLKKDGTGDKYQYVTADKLLGYLRPIMDEVGLLLVSEVKEAEYTRQDYDTRNGRKSEMFCALKMLFTWIDVDTGETLPVEWAASGMNNWDKGSGSAASYAERYMLLKFFHIPTSEDDVDAVKTPEEEMNDMNWESYINSLNSVQDLDAAWAQYGAGLKGNKAVVKAFNLRKKALTDGTN